MAVKFYCENCKLEVPLYASSCPYCKREFFSVYCPSCGKEGSVVEFRNGCPYCGYLKETYKSSKKKKITRQVKSKEENLPRWFYGASIIILILGIIGLLIIMALGIKLF